MKKRNTLLALVAKKKEERYTIRSIMIVKNCRLLNRFDKFSSKKASMNSNDFNKLGWGMSLF